MYPSLDGFKQALQGFSANLDALSHQEHDLMQRKDALGKRITQASQFDDRRLHAKSPLRQQVNALRESIQKAFELWDQKIQDSLPMKQLTSQYQDRIIFLIFGKVNAGKSSFANFVTEQFDSKDIRRFRFENGKVVYMNENERFKEGFTETTAEIQGVELGENLVLLDSPGLHSVTPVNGDLTRKFIDSADAVLWLSPSTSPGQVQELRDLKDELEKRKPLQPIITRSDSLEEDEDANNELIQKIVNKTIKNRALQENDVLSRLQDFNGVVKEMVRLPVSISVHAYKYNEPSLENFRESGLACAFDRLAALVSEAAEYKGRKAQQQLHNFMKNEVAHSLRVGMLPRIEGILQELQRTTQEISVQKEIIAEKVIAYVKRCLHDLIEQNKESRDKKSLLKALNEAINQSINQELEPLLRSLVQDMAKISVELNENQVDDFKDKTVDVERRKGSAKSSLAGSGGAVAGTLLGAELGSVVPVVGTVIGGIVGGIAGHWIAKKAGDSYFVETETVNEVVGTSTEEINASLSKQIDQLVPTTVQKAVEQVTAQLQPVAEMCQRLQGEIERFERDLNVEGSETNVA